MNEYLLIVLAILWLASGVTSFVYWWTSESDFTGNQVGVACYSSLLGPFNFFVGWLVYAGTSQKPSRVFFKKRK